MMHASDIGISGTEVARRFGLLLERFPRADGEPWRAIEIEEATGGMVTGSYISALKRGKLKRPGMFQLEMIAYAVGFPFDLWRLEPELWDDHLEEHPPQRGFRSPLPGQPVPTVPTGTELAALLEDLLRRKPNPKTGEPYGEEEIAKRSRGRLSAEEIRRMREGGQLEPPAEVTLVALSEVFGVPASYWYAPKTAEFYDSFTEEERVLRGILETLECMDLARLRQVSACVGWITGRLRMAEDLLIEHYAEQDPDAEEALEGEADDGHPRWEPGKEG